MMNWSRCPVDPANREWTELGLDRRPSNRFIPTDFVL